MKRLRVGVSLILLVVFVAVGGGAARADRTAEEAKRLYAEGTKNYNLGDFTKAIESYKAAYRLREDPVFLYNIAQAYRLLKDFEQALFFYKAFLRNMPNAPNRAEVDTRIAEMEEQQKRRDATATAPPVGPATPSTLGSEPVPEPDDATGRTTIPSPVEAAEAGEETGPSSTLPDDSPGKKPIYKKWWFWAGVGAVAAGTVAVVVLTSSGGGISNQPDTVFGSERVFE